MNSLIQVPRCYTVEMRQIEIEQHLLLAHKIDRLRGSMDQYDFLAHANKRAICVTVVLKMLKMNCGAVPRANMRSVTGTTTNFSLRNRSGNALQLSVSGPLKSACIMRMKTT